MKNKILAVLIGITLLSSAASALDTEYTEVKKPLGGTVVVVDLTDKEGNFVSRGVSGTKGTKEDKEHEALEDAVKNIKR